MTAAQPLTHESFQPHLHREFRFEGRPHVLKLTHIEVKDGAPLPGLPYMAFALIFSGPRDDVMPEGFYAAETQDGARFDFYVMPIHTPASDRQDYQAVFN
jgi:hypothetical protein